MCMYVRVCLCMCMCVQGCIVYIYHVIAIKICWTFSCRICDLCTFKKKGNLHYCMQVSNSYFQSHLKSTSSDWLLIKIKTLHCLSIISHTSIMWSTTWYLCAPFHRKVATIETLLWDSTFHYYSQSGSMIQAIVMEVAILAEFLPGAYAGGGGGGGGGVVGGSTPTPPPLGPFCVFFCCLSERLVMYDVYPCSVSGKLTREKKWRTPPPPPPPPPSGPGTAC